MKEDQRRELERMEKLAAEIERNPLTKKFREDEAALILSKRLEAAGKLEALRKEQGEVIPKLREAVKDKEAKYLEAKVLLDAAQDEINLARFSLSSSNNNFDTDIRNQEAILFESADPIIEETITFFRDKHAALCRKTVDRQTHKVGTNMFKMAKELITFSNARSIASAVVYCLNSIRALETMRLEPVPDVARIDELKRNIQDVGAMEEITADKPLPRINVDPRSLLPSDSEMDWTMGKLTEKFKKLMAKGK